MHGRSTLLAAKLPPEGTLSLYVKNKTRIARQRTRLVLTPAPERSVARCPEAKGGRLSIAQRVRKAKLEAGALKMMGK
jgi:hypothetical protein